MRSLTTVAVLAGPLVLVSYLIGAATATRLERPDGVPRAGDHVIEAVIAVVVATVAWRLVQRVSPGGDNFSRISLFSNQVLAAWHSVALWCGLATVAGVAAPVFRRFQGAPALAGAGALLVAFTPPLFLAALAGAGIGHVVGRGDPSITRIAAIAPVLPTSWLAWVFDWPSGWGVQLGPEVTVWAMVLCMVLGVRWWTDEQSRPAGAGPT